MTSQSWTYRRTRELFAEFGITGWHVAFDNARQRAGQTRYRSRTVSFSKHFVASNTAERVEQTIRHEIAHVLAGAGAGHGPIWKAKCRITGHTGEREYSAADTVMPAKPWRGTCGCGAAWERHRLTAYMQNAICTACGKKITWVRRVS